MRTQPCQGCGWGLEHADIAPRYLQDAGHAPKFSSPNTAAAAASVEEGAVGESVATTSGSTVGMLHENLIDSSKFDE